MADQIRIGDVTPRVRYVADGVTAQFTYPFPIFAETDLEVYIDGVQVAYPAGYVVEGAGSRAGGTVVLASPPAGNTAVTLVRRLTIARMSDFTTTGEFRAAAINDELDFQVAALQQVKDDLVRSIRLSEADGAAALVLPDAALRAERVFAFDGRGDAVATYVIAATEAPAIGAATPPPGTSSGSSGISSEASAYDHAHPLPGWNDIGLASQAEAEAGTDDTKVMTSIRASQAMAAYGQPTDTIARDMAVSALAYAIASADSVMLTGNVGKFILTDDFAADSLPTSANAIFDAARGYYHNPDSMTTASSLAAWNGATDKFTFSGDDIQGVIHDYSIRTNDTLDGNFSFDFKWSCGGNNPRIGIYLTSDDAGFNPNSNSGGNLVGNSVTTAADSVCVEAQSSTSFRVYKSNVQQGGTITVAEQDALRIYREGATIKVSKGGIDQVTVTGNLPGTYRGVICEGNFSSTDFDDVSWTVPAPPGNMELAPAPEDLADADPLDVVGYFVFELVDTISFGIDIVGAVSLDGGSTYATGSWTRIGNVGDEERQLYRLDADVSAQSGSSLTYRLTTANNKQVRFHGCVGLVAIY
ncbi:MAG: hypothetical protein ACFE0S_12535 [Rhodospirillales bacterium]